MLPLLHTCKFERISNAVAAGSSDSDSSSVDISGFNSACFIVAFGAIVSGAATSIKIQGSADNSTFVDLETTSQTVGDTDDNKLFIGEVVKPNPTYRYLRVRVSRATQNATIDSIVAILSNANGLVPTNGSTVGGTPEVAVTPGSGTA